MALNTNMKDTISRLLTIKKAAIYSGIPIWGLRGLIGIEAIPFIKLGNKFYLDVQDIEDWIQSNKRGCIHINDKEG